MSGPTKADAALDALAQRIGHAFRDPRLLEEALTHVSATAGPRSGAPNYQRLEFLGDRVLGLAIAHMLSVALPRAREGELSRRLAELVRRETCVEVALAWMVGPALRLGVGERQTGGETKPAILGDVCESIIGAVFLDGGWDAAFALVERNWSPRLAVQPARLNDAKTTLQEWAQGRGLPTPAYGEVGRTGPEHKPVFVIAVAVEGFAPCEGEPEANKKLAAQAAAQAFLERERIWIRNDAKRQEKA